jgi:excisionase family DNA binding protein
MKDEGERIHRVTCSVRDAANALGLSENTVWGLLRDRLLSSVKVGRRTLIAVSELSAFADRQAQSSK